MNKTQLTEWFKTLSLLFFSTSVRIENSKDRDAELQRVAEAIDNGNPDAEKLLRNINSSLCEEINNTLEDINRRKQNNFKQAQQELNQKNPELN